jgi:hypothetical protein
MSEGLNDWARSLTPRRLGRTSHQTNEVNANPNGTLQGNWPRQQVVHGDGTQ